MIAIKTKTVLLSVWLTMVAIADSAEAANGNQGSAVAVQAAQSQGFPTSVFTLLSLFVAAVVAFRFLIEPFLMRRRLRMVIATGLWLSCYELRLHLEAINKTISGDDETARQTRDALLKRPRSDFHGRADWFVKTGYFCMVTAYRISAFSAWMRIYQTSVIQAVFTLPRSKMIPEQFKSNFIPELFGKFDAFKTVTSNNTHLWYGYIDAIGERIIVMDGEIKSPIGFSEFCKRYYCDAEFRDFFDQLHMFLHFMGRTDSDYPIKYRTALSEMIRELTEIEEFLEARKENLLSGFAVRERRRTYAPELVQEQNNVIGE
jgi:hypothetical protein